MDKIPFEDGVKLKNATVTVNEQEYEVTPAQYSGTTPMSAFNLNKMQDNIESEINTTNSNLQSLDEKTSVNVLKAILNQDNTKLTSTADYQIVNIPLIQDLKVGDKLSFTGGKIAIGTGINHVRISGACIIQNSSQANLHGFAIMKNSTEFVSVYKTLSSTSYNDFQIPSAIYKVQEGDTFSMGIYLNIQGNSTTIKKYTRSTFLQVEAID